MIALLQNPEVLKTANLVMLTGLIFGGILKETVFSGVQKASSLVTCRQSNSSAVRMIMGS